MQKRLRLAEGNLKFHFFVFPLIQFVVIYIYIYFIFFRINKRDHDGLSINYDLTSGTSNRCLTFDNEPLSSAINFEISCLEIIGFTN